MARTKKVHLFKSYKKQKEEEKKESIIKSKYKERLSVPNKEITIVKENNTLRFIRFVFLKFESLLRLVIYLIITGLISLAITVLINANMRTQILELIKNNIK